MIRYIFRIHRMRKFIKKERRETGRCQNCGKTKKCDSWCYGPVFRRWLWIYLTSRNNKKFIWSLFKYELKWAGVEPWHRYE